MGSEDNIILFPKWKKKLEKESLEALKNKQFEIALDKLNKLLSYQVKDYEIITGKLICLMELNRYNEAQDLCEELIKEESDHYYQFIHIYLTILFQTNQYDLLMEQAEFELEKKDLPEVYRNQFLQLYEMSEKMRIDIQAENSSTYFDELFQMIQEENHTRQWQLVESLKREKARPNEKIMDLLVNSMIHPVVKTALFEWMREARIRQKVTIHKFNRTLAMIPIEMLEIGRQEIYKQIALSFAYIEHQNPALYYMLEQILYRYAYVLYPFLPEESDVHYIGNALVEIGTKYLNIQNPSEQIDEAATDRVNHYIEKITTCESLYMSIIEV